MRLTRLGRSNLEVSEVGLGCMSLGADVAENERIVRRALDCGINFFDTADLYDRGENEVQLGRALQGRRDEVVLATKGGNRWRADGKGWDWDPSPRYLRCAVEGSLRRLEVDHIDLYQLHGGTLSDPIDEIVETFEDLVRAGVIGAYGISSIRPNVIREFLNRSNLSSVMLQYSVLDRRAEEQVFDLLAEHSVEVIARGPLAKGVLTDRERADSVPSGVAPGHDEATVRRAIDTLRELRACRRADDQVPPSSALSVGFALSHPAVNVALVGASRLSQLEEIAGGPVELTPSEVEALKQAAPARRYEQHR